MCPPAIETEVTELSSRGCDVELITANGQCYALVHSLPAPSPPWDRTSYDVLIAVPAAYSAGGLDGFYLALPYTFNGSNHPRVNGSTLTYDGRQWQLVSWHYPEGSPWQRGRDSLETHITHCAGFFAHRGAVNAY